jgi:hypothetical protein
MLYLIDGMGGPQNGICRMSGAPAFLSKIRVFRASTQSVGGLNLLRTLHENVGNGRTEQIDVGDKVGTVLSVGLLQGFCANERLQAAEAETI